MPKKVTCKQAKVIKDRISPTHRYLNKLKSRMVQVGFVPDDKLLRLVDTASDAMQSLWVELHYLSCDGGVG